MSTCPQSQRLLQRVQSRQRWRQVSVRAFWLLIGIAALYAVLLLAGRLSGLFPDWFSPWTVSIVPAAAVLLALLWPRRVPVQAAAHAIDTHARTQDLFLTLTSLGPQAWEYAPIVARDAESAAAGIKPHEVVPFHWEHPSLISTGVLAALLLGAFFVPALDPFGQVAAAKQQDEIRKLLEETQNVTEARQAQLAQKDVEKENSEAVEQALQGLKTSFQQMKSGEPRQNLEKLNVHQKELGEMYRKLNSGELKSLFDKLQTDQKLGQLHDQDLFRQWQKELQEGKSEGLERELDKISADMKQLAQTTDPVARTELQRKIQKELKELSDFAASKAGSKSLNAALQRAMQQLDAAKQEGLSKEAMQALQESLGVCEKEMQMLAQSARDMKDLEDALKLISMAKQCNGKCEKDGEGDDADMTLADYAELYARLMQEAAQQGEGTGNEGTGGGAKVDEDDSIATNFVDEKSKSAIQKGKILLSMKTKGLSEAGDVKDENYKRIVGELRQSLEDAISQEEIPPGYVGGIKKYFDTIEKK